MVQLLPDPWETAGHASDGSWDHGPRVEREGTSCQPSSTLVLVLKVNVPAVLHAKVLACFNRLLIDVARVRVLTLTQPPT